jgi:beta-lactam-binding protein with PASTA domain
MAASKGLKLEVIDSTYSKKTPLGTIVEQNPQAGSHVKHGRSIYVIQNAHIRKPVILPNLEDLSLRQAEATIQSLGLTIEDITYEPSTYKNIILEVRHADTVIHAGTRLEEGSAVTLVVGQGQGTQEVSVPNIVGLSLTEAQSWLRTNSLRAGIVEYDVEPTEENKTQYIIYSQEPKDGTIIVEGSAVNIKLSLNREKAITADSEGDEEEFF